jgi:hypothetical protein
MFSPPINPSISSESYLIRQWINRSIEIKLLQGEFISAIPFPENSPSASPLLISLSGLICSVSQLAYRLS